MWKTYCDESLQHLQKPNKNIWVWVSKHVIYNSKMRDAAYIALSWDFMRPGLCFIAIMSTNKHCIRQIHSYCKFTIVGVNVGRICSYFIMLKPHSAIQKKVSFQSLQHETILAPPTSCLSLLLEGESAEVVGLSRQYATLIFQNLPTSEPFLFRHSLYHRWQ